jgi:hypothetical protein
MDTWAFAGKMSMDKMIGGSERCRQFSTQADAPREYGNLELVELLPLVVVDYVASG